MDADWKDKDYAAHYNKLYATPAREFGAYAEMLALGKGDFLVDFGCGNGDFLLLACEKVGSALGVDVSGAQVEAARKKLSGRPNSEVVLSAFLDFNPGRREFTKGFSRKALHHLTDPEKEKFILSVAPAFKPGALFLLEDGMFFDFPRAAMEENWEALMAEAARYYGEGWEARKTDIIHSLREEFPTGAGEWARIFEKAGFKIQRRLRKCSFYGALLAVKG